MTNQKKEVSLGFTLLYIRILNLNSKPSLRLLYLFLLTYYVFEL
jgi:hypothetical protein